MDESSTKLWQEAVVSLFAPGLTLGSFPSRACTFIRALADCDCCIFGELCLKTGELVVQPDEALPDFNEAFAGYGRHMAHYSFTNYDPTVTNGQPFLRENFISHRQFRELDVYREGFRVAGLNDHAAIPVATRDPAVIFLGVERQVGSFAPSILETLMRLQPHLRNARELAAAQTRLPTPTGPRDLAFAGLTARQSEVLFWMTHGKSNAEIGSLMRLRLSTVKGYVVSIFNKLGVDNRHAAILCALEHMRQSEEAEALRSPQVRFQTRGRR